MSSDGLFSLEAPFRYASDLPPLAGITATGATPIDRDQLIIRKLLKIQEARNAKNARKATLCTCTARGHFAQRGGFSVALAKSKYSPQYLKFMNRDLLRPPQRRPCRRIVAACRQKRRVRFTTAAGLVNELVEAKHQLQLRRVLGRWSRYDLIAIDEVGYVPLAEVGAEFLFQVVAERAEKAAVILTTNLPFSEWTQVIPNARLCKALLDRITDRAHILETGTESYRFRRTAEKQKKGAKAS